MTLELARHRFSVEQYYRMTQIHVLPEDASNELIDGVVLDVAPISPRHAAATNCLNAQFHMAIRENEAIVSVPGPVHIDEVNEPNFDLALLEFRPNFYQDHTPGPEEVSLLIEVSDTSLLFDRRVKMPLYAAAGVREVWLVDVTMDRIEVLTKPGSSGFADLKICERGDVLSPLAFPHIKIQVENVVGPGYSPERKG